jgi:D-alanyl-D-alanine carboxypeptidase
MTEFQPTSRQPMVAGGRMSRRLQHAAFVVALVLIASASSSVANASGHADHLQPRCSAQSVKHGVAGAAVVDVVKRVARENDLTSVLYRVTKGGDVVASGAFGDNLTGVPADPLLHFRIGNVAFGYMGTLLLRLVEKGKASASGCPTRTYRRPARSLFACWSRTPRAIRTTSPTTSS